MRCKSVWEFLQYQNGPDHLPHSFYLHGKKKRNILFGTFLFLLSSKIPLQQRALYDCTSSHDHLNRSEESYFYFPNLVLSMYLRIHEQELG